MKEKTIEEFKKEIADLEGKLKQSEQNHALYRKVLFTLVSIGVVGQQDLDELTGIIDRLNH